MKKLTILIILALVLSGCATAKVKQDEEANRLKGQIQQLENEVSLRDKRQKETEKLLENEIGLRRSLEEKLNQQEHTKQAPTVRHVQTALKTAGFNPGPIDGKMGEKTKNAVKEFQKANGLEPDGAVGVKTWSRLKSFLP